MSETNNPGSCDPAVGRGSWYAAYTQPKREQVAATNLRQQGFEAYFPQYKTVRTSPLGPLPVFGPMFPRYVFFRPGKAGQSISGARSTQGVSFVLSFGFQPALLKVEQLQAIQAFEHERNRADLGAISPFQPGLQVRLRDFGLKRLEGLVQSVSAKRVTVLLELLGTQNIVRLAHHQLELARKGIAGDVANVHRRGGRVGGGGISRWKMLCV